MWDLPPPVDDRLNSFEEQLITYFVFLAVFQAREEFEQLGILLHQLGIEVVIRQGGASAIPKEVDELVLHLEREKGADLELFNVGVQKKMVSGNAHCAAFGVQAWGEDRFSERDHTAAHSR